MSLQEVRSPITGPAADLIRDLWWFIENVTEETPDRTDRFFALRERVHNMMFPPNREELVVQAYETLRTARNLLTKAKAPKAVQRVRLAMTSAQGAIRHAHHDRYREERNPAWAKRVLGTK